MWFEWTTSIVFFFSILDYFVKQCGIEWIQTKFTHIPNDTVAKISQSNESTAIILLLLFLRLWPIFVNWVILVMIKRFVITSSKFSEKTISSLFFWLHSKRRFIPFPHLKIIGSKWTINVSRRSGCFFYQWGNQTSVIANSLENLIKT